MCESKLKVIEILCHTSCGVKNMKIKLDRLYAEKIPKYCSFSSAHDYS